VFYVLSTGVDKPLAPPTCKRSERNEAQNFDERSMSFSNSTQAQQYGAITDTNTSDGTEQRDLTETQEILGDEANEPTSKKVAFALDKPQDEKTPLLKTSRIFPFSSLTKVISDKSSFNKHTNIYKL
jgi:hypothetical protein